MGRPPTPLGAYGKIRFVQRPSGAWRARTLFRNLDGRTRPISRNGLSRAAAERALKLAISERTGSPNGQGAIDPNIKIADLADRCWDRPVTCP